MNKRHFFSGKQLILFQFLVNLMLSSTLHSLYGLRLRPRKSFSAFAISRGINLIKEPSVIGKTLVIVESPAKAKTIQKFVDDSYIIDSCAGHVRDLPQSARSTLSEFKKDYVLEELKLNVADLGVKVRDNFEPLYVPLEGKSEIVKRLTKLSKSCSKILLATDEDREGEAISWHLLELLQPIVPYKRAVFHEITKDAILESFNNPRDIDMDIVHSQETRRILDRLAGYTISPMLWR